MRTAPLESQAKLALATPLLLLELLLPASARALIVDGACVLGVVALWCWPETLQAPARLERRMGRVTNVHAMTALAMLSIVLLVDPGVGLLGLLAVASWHLAYLDCERVGIRPHSGAGFSHALLLLGLAVGAKPTVLAWLMAQLGASSNPTVLANMSATLLGVGMSSLIYHSLFQAKVRRMLLDDAVVLSLFYLATPAVAVTLYAVVWVRWPAVAALLRPESSRPPT